MAQPFACVRMYSVCACDCFSSFFGGSSKKNFGIDRIRKFMQIVKKNRSMSCVRWFAGKTSGCTRGVVFDQFCICDKRN